MGRREHTEEMKLTAKQVNILSAAQELGYTITQNGSHYSLKEHDSVIFYLNTNSYYQYSRRQGGDVLTFLQNLGGEKGYHFDLYDAIEWLLELSGQKQHIINVEKFQRTLEQKAFTLPARESGPYRRAYAYLKYTRGIDTQVIDYFIKNKLMYESAEHHNLVFVGHDKHGIVRFASQRGTNDLVGKPFKRDVAGNDKNYGVNKVNHDSEELYVFEGAIDMMSYMSMTGDDTSNKLALGMVADNPLVRFLTEHLHIKKINFCMDMDRAGREATQAHMEKYAGMGYEVCDFSKEYFGKMQECYGMTDSCGQELFHPGKDFNELLKAVNQIQQDKVRVR